MKSHRVYWRRKNKKIIAEGISKGKTIYLFTLPDPEELIRRIESVYLGDAKDTRNPSTINKEQLEKIKQKISRLDFKQNKGKNNE